jgi:2'-5' RNA ligase
LRVIQQAEFRVGSRRQLQANRGQLLLAGSDDWPAQRGSDSRSASTLMFLLRPPKDLSLRMHQEAERHTQNQAAGPAYPAHLLHMSLLCLGRFDAPPKAIIARAKAAAASIQARPIPITLDSSGFMGGKRQLALYPAKGNQRIVQFGEILGRSLRHHNLPGLVEKQPTPHVTLIHDSNTDDLMSIERNYAWIAGEFVLVFSHHQEARHEEIGRWSLDPKAPPYAAPAEQLRMAI